MDEVIGFSNYKQYKESLDRELNKTAENFVVIGYLLKVARDTNILYESGYETVTRFAEAEYNLRPDQVTRFMQINDRYSEGGYSTSLQDAYIGMGYTKLVEMLQLPLTIAQELTPDFTREDIKELRSEVEEEEKITDLEVMLEPKEWDGEIPILQQIIIQLGHDNQEWYRRVYDWNKEKKSLREFKLVMDPTGSTIYSIRIRGLGKFLLCVKEKEEFINIINVRTKEKTAATWHEVMNFAMDLIEKGTWEESWQQVYGEKIVPEKPPASVNTESGRETLKKKKEKVVAVKRQENKDKHEPEKYGTDIERTGTEQNQQPEEKPVGEVRKTEKIAPEQTEEKPIGTRKDYLDGLTEYGAAGEIADHIRKIRKTAEDMALETYSHWEKWLSEDVDVCGNTWEYGEIEE